MVGSAGVVDVEDGINLGFAAVGISRSYVASNILLNDSTLRDALSTYNNGVLDVRSRDTLRVE